MNDKICLNVELCHQIHSALVKPWQCGLRLTNVPECSVGRKVDDLAADTAPLNAKPPGVANEAALRMDLL